MRSLPLFTPENLNPHLVQTRARLCTAFPSHTSLLMLGALSTVGKEGIFFCDSFFFAVSRSLVVLPRLETTA